MPGLGFNEVHIYVSDNHKSQHPDKINYVERDKLVEGGKFCKELPIILTEQTAVIACLNNSSLPQFSREVMEVVRRLGHR